jgi:hypothetical protein
MRSFAGGVQSPHKDKSTPCVQLNAHGMSRQEIKLYITTALLLACGLLDVFALRSEISPSPKRDINK